MLKVYLDNNVVSAMAKDDTALESSALDRLLEAYEKKKVELVTSELTLQEITRYQGFSRKSMERMFRLLAKVPVVRWDELLGINVYADQYTCINSPLIRNDPLYESLLKLGLKVPDAQHVFVAAKQGCAYVITCDGGVLSRAKDIEALSGVGVLKPSELVAQQQWDEK